MVVAGIWFYGSSSSSSKGASAKDAPVPVSVVPAAVRNTPVNLGSVGTVRAYNTVLVRSLVDGQISRVAFTEGAEVRRGQVLVELDRRPFEAQLRAARAQREKDAAQLANAETDFQRYEGLARKDSVPIQVLDTTRALVAQLKASVHGDEAQIEQAQLQLDYATIRSPIDGRAGARLVDAGNLVHAADANGLLTVVQIHPVMVEFALPQSVMAEVVRRQAQAPLPVEALESADRPILARGSLNFIDNHVDVTTRTVLCKALFANKDETLLPGAFVTARIRLADLPQAVVVPTRAIHPGPAGSVVYVVSAGKTAELRPVEVGVANGGDSVIVRGLKEGELVVTEGQFQIEQGTRVEVHLEGADSPDDASSMKTAPKS